MLESGWSTTKGTVQIALKIYKDIVATGMDARQITSYLDEIQTKLAKKSFENALKLLVRVRLLTKEFSPEGDIQYKLNSGGSDDAMTLINNNINKILQEIKTILLEPKKWPDFTPNQMAIERRKRGMEIARESKHHNKIN